MTITLAVDRYDRLMPFHDGTVELPAGLDLKVLQVGQEGQLREGAHRHERMLLEGEFDAAEVSLSSYVAACARGLPFTAIPVFPRRLFSLGQVFVHARSSLSHPRELAGRTIGLQSFQTTLAVLAKGDMAAEYGLDLRSVRWLTRSAETVEVTPSPDFQTKQLPAGVSLIDAIVRGEVDAIFYSRTPWREPDPSLPIRRLFADPQEEERRYYAKNGYWPIMHLVVLKKAIAERIPELPMQLMRAFESAHRIADGYVDDPGWSRLAWTKYTRESEAAAFAAKLWPLGVAANRANLERFIGYSHDQGIIGRRIAVEQMFHPSVHET
jgi:4,5-dihydroxyphthalate decarboxylase